MRILLLARIFFSGQTTHVIELAKELAAQRHQVAVLAYGCGHPQAWEAYRPVLEASGVRTYRAQKPGELQGVWATFDPDVVHVHSSDLIAWACGYARAKSVPVIVTCHGLGVARKCPQIKQADHVIAVGPNVQADLLQAGIRHITLIQNGVDTDRFRPSTEARKTFTPPMIAYVGRIDVAKRRALGELIEAVSVIPGAHLTLASNEHIHHPRVTCVGWLTDVAPLMAGSHIVVGTGRAIREAMASGCVAVVLGQTYGGVVTPETFGAHRKVALSFSGMHGKPPNRSDILNDLIKLSQDTAQCANLGQWGRAVAMRHFSLKEMTSRVISLYQDVCQRSYDVKTRKASLHR